LEELDKLALHFTDLFGDVLEGWAEAASVTPEVVHASRWR
jgi:hypothetical protein